MTQLRQFERAVRDDLERTAQAVRVPAGALDRAIRAARAQEQADADWGASPGRTRPWLRPLAAAAAVLILIAGVALASHWPVGGDRSRPTQHPTPAPTVFPSPTPSSTTALALPRPGAPVLQAHTLSLGPAKLTLPPGWSATAVPGVAPIGLTQWCLHPTSQPVVGSDCPISFTELGVDAVELSSIDPDYLGAFLAVPDFCGPRVHFDHVLVDDADKAFGTRTADFRRWVVTCPNGSIHNIEQYMVLTSPGFMLISEQADADVRQVMASLAGSAVLPVQASPVQLTDSGIVRSVHSNQDGYVIELDRVVDGAPNVSSKTYRYVIPAAVLRQSLMALNVGEHIRIVDDGAMVTELLPAYHLPEPAPGG